MLEISRIDHVAMAVPELGPQIKILEGLFGFRADGEWEDQADGHVGVNLTVPGDSGIGW